MKQAAKLSYTKVMAELKAAGTAQNQKVFSNHGVTGKLYGVSYAFLKKLIKQVKIDHGLALKLWASEIHDARVFACWSADAKVMTMAQVNAWARDVDNHVICGEVAGLAQDFDNAAAIAAKWMAMKNEWRSALGWAVFARLAMQVDRGVAEGGLDKAQIEDALVRIEAELQKAPNRARQNMNGALIAIGCRKGFKAKALATAKRIGPVEVDHGDTNCETRDAAATIRRTVEHYAKKGKLPTDGTAGKRRRHC